MDVCDDEPRRHPDRVVCDDHLPVDPSRRCPGRPKRLTDAKLVCLAVAQVLLARAANIIGCECVTAGWAICFRTCRESSRAITSGSRPPRR